MARRSAATMGFAVRRGLPSLVHKTRAARPSHTVKIDLAREHLPNEEYEGDNDGQRAAREESARYRVDAREYDTVVPEAQGEKRSVNDSLPWGS